MAIDGQVVFGVNGVENWLEFKLILQLAALELLVLRKAVALDRADADRVEAVHAAGTENVAIDLHAGNNRDRQIRVIFEIVLAMVGERQEIIAVLHVLGDDLFGRALSVGASGVAVQTALEHAVLAGKRLLLHKNSPPDSNWVVIVYSGKAEKASSVCAGNDICRRARD